MHDKHDFLANILFDYPEHVHNGIRRNDDIGLFLPLTCLTIK